MIIDLTDTNASEIAAALVQARRNAGSPAMGMVLTLIVVADETTHYDALRAAMLAAKEHPSRIIGVIPRDGNGKSRLDAEVRVGGEGGPGESLLLRLYGELSQHPESVVMPLLLSESPVVTWWPGSAPPVPSRDPLGQLARRRVTDAATAADPIATLTRHCSAYAPGDTDLAWTRTTPWRALLAAALDRHEAKVTGATIEAQAGNPSALLMGTWLERQLHITVTYGVSEGPGITAARLHTEKGDIAVTRADGRLAHYALPDQPPRRVALKRRDTSELLAEELRRLDPDDVYGLVVEELVRKQVHSHGHKPHPTEGGDR
ncbi:MAG TPA: glucose-6-phosphate dehydrogenase assembly protein OpcA [Actinopolymorphaceae bacterium]|jgi:glucose-6-phosphate dehydrogenase assembly protein OpcA